MDLFLVISGRSTALKTGEHSSRFGLSYIIRALQEALCLLASRSNTTACCGGGLGRIFGDPFLFQTTAAGCQDVMLHIGPAVTNAGLQKLMNMAQEVRDGAIEGNVPSEHYQGSS